MASTKRILFIQYTNPACYPPLEHSSRILAHRGWNVLFLGAQVTGVEHMTFPGAAGVRVRLFGKVPRSGFGVKLHFLGFFAWCLWRAFWFRPQWIYASDSWSTPAAWFAKRLFGTKLLYHEHDSPSIRLPTETFRARVAQDADAIVFPQPKRAQIFLRELRPTVTPDLVMNCPRLSEIPERPRHEISLPLKLLFQGSIGPSRLPLAVIRALKGLPVDLLILGYVPEGAQSHAAALKREAEKEGVGTQLDFLGSFPRHEMFAFTAQAHVGLSLMPFTSRDVNERHMVGASNKVFDHLAFGTPLLVSDLPEWREAYVDPGFAKACDPEDPASIAAALKWFVDHPKELSEMGRRGHKRCLEEWNYDAQFASVLEKLEGPAEHSERWPRTAKSS